MRLYPKQIWKENFRYYTYKSPESIKSDIQHLLNKTKDWNFSVNLAGAFISENEFRITPKWQFGYIKNFERDLSYLDGKIYKDELERTRIDFSVRPNSIFAIFFFSFFLIGIFELTNSNTVDKKYGLVVGIIFTFIVPIAMIAFGYFAKKGIKERFIKTFDLKPVE